METKFIRPATQSAQAPEAGCRRRDVGRDQSASGGGGSGFPRNPFPPERLCTRRRRRCLAAAGPHVPPSPQYRYIALSGGMGRAGRTAQEEQGLACPGAGGG